jgi:hypothetical protein
MRDSSTESQTGITLTKRRTEMLTRIPFVRELLLVIAGVLILVATTAFVAIPYTLERYPLTTAQLGTPVQNYHLT